MAKVQRKVMVVGGGPAGMKAAVIAAQRGHRVTLFEAQKRLGGKRCSRNCSPVVLNSAGWSRI
jgi:NADPH-dependent 2,4-dienoyl-CoA reductase/sulfur reductase-like enzyme